MARLFLYLGMMALGMFFGSRKALRSRKFPWIHRVQSVMLILLIFVLGVSTGTDDRVFDSLGEIGISAAVITTFAVVGSLLCVTILRRLLGITKDGRKKSAVEQETPL